MEYLRTQLPAFLRKKAGPDPKLVAQRDWDTLGHPNDDFLALFNLLVHISSEANLQIPLFLRLHGSVGQELGQGASSSVYIYPMPLGLDMAVTGDGFMSLKEKFPLRLPGQNSKLIVAKYPRVELNNDGLPADSIQSQRLANVIFELRTLANRNLYRHPNIVQLLGVAWTPGTAGNLLPVLVVEHADMGTLDMFRSRFIPKPKRISIMLKISKDVANGLAVLHECGIVHGDLNAKNVLIFASEQTMQSHNDEPPAVVAKLADFGFSLSTSTGNNQQKGITWPWNPPEANDVVDPMTLLKSDIYCFGLLVWTSVVEFEVGENYFQVPRHADDEEQESFIQRLDTSKMTGSILDDATKSVTNHDHFGMLSLVVQVFTIQLLNATIQRDPDKRSDAYQIVEMFSEHEFLQDESFSKETRSSFVLESVLSSYKNYDPMTTLRTFEKAPYKLKSQLVEAVERVYKLGIEADSASVENGTAAVFATHASFYYTVGFGVEKDIRKALMILIKFIPQPIAIHWALSLMSEPNMEIPQEISMMSEVVFLRIAPSTGTFLTLRGIRGYFSSFESYAWFRKHARRFSMIERWTEDGDMVNFTKCLDFTTEVQTLLMAEKSSDITGDTCVEARKIQDKPVGKWQLLVQKTRLEDHEGVNEQLRHLEQLKLQGGQQRSQSLLHLAVICEFHESVRLLISQSEDDDLQAKNYHGDTPLLLACRIGDAVSTELLLKDGRSSIRALSNVGESVLHFLSEFEGVNVGIIAEMLFERSAIVHLQQVAQVQRGQEHLAAAVGGEVGWELFPFAAEGTPLHRCVLLESFEAVKGLLDRGADPTSNDFGLSTTTPLHIAASLHLAEIFACLVQNCKEKHPEFLEKDKRLVPELFIHAITNSLPYRLRQHHTRHREKMLATIDVFFDSLQDLLPMDTNSVVSYLNAALMVGERDVLEKLLTEPKIRKCINSREQETQVSPLMVGLTQGWVETVEVLFDHGAEPVSAMTEVEGNAISAIHLCVMTGENDEMMRIVEILLEKGLHVDEGKETAFCVAVQLLHLKMADLLISRGANPNVIVQSVTETWFSGPFSEYNLTIFGLMIASSSEVTLRAINYLLALEDKRPFVAITKDGQEDTSTNPLIMSSQVVTGLRSSQSATRSAQVLKTLLGYFDTPEQINFQDKHGWTSLQYGAAAGNSLVVRNILERSPDENLVVNHPILGLCTAKEIAEKSLATLDCSSESETRKELIQYLKEKGMLRTINDITRSVTDEDILSGQLIELFKVKLGETISEFRVHEENVKDTLLGETGDKITSNIESPDNGAVTTALQGVEKVSKRKQFLPPDALKKITTSFKSLFRRDTLVAGKGLDQSEQSVSSNSSSPQLTEHSYPNEKSLQIPVISATVNAFLPPSKLGNHNPVAFKYIGEDEKETIISSVFMELSSSYAELLNAPSTPEKLSTDNPTSSFTVQVLSASRTLAEEKIICTTAAINRIQEGQCLFTCQCDSDSTGQTHSHLLDHMRATYSILVIEQLYLQMAEPIKGTYMIRSIFEYHSQLEEDSRIVLIRASDEKHIPSIASWASDLLQLAGRYTQRELSKDPDIELHGYDKETDTLSYMDVQGYLSFDSTVQVELQPASMIGNSRGWSYRQIITGTRLNVLHLSMLREVTSRRIEDRYLIQRHHAWDVILSGRTVDHNRLFTLVGRVTSRDGDWFHIIPLKNTTRYKTSITFQAQEISSFELDTNEDGAVDIKSLNHQTSIVSEPHGNLRLTFYTPGNKLLHQFVLHNLFLNAVVPLFKANSLMSVYMDWSETIIWNCVFNGLRIEFSGFSQDIPLYCHSTIVRDTQMLRLRIISIIMVNNEKEFCVVSQSLFPHAFIRRMYGEEGRTVVGGPTILSLNIGSASTFSGRDDMRVTYGGWEDPRWKHYSKIFWSCAKAAREEIDVIARRRGKEALESAQKRTVHA